MTDDDFLEGIRERFDSPWLAPAIAEVDRQMNGDGGHDFGHLLRVFRNACTIVDATDIEGDFVSIVAAIVFHDVVNLPKNHPERHTASARSADVAIAFLAPYADSGELNLELVAEAIRCHSFSAGLIPRSFEAQVVADADSLESVGAFGIARTFYVAGRMGSAIVDMVDPAASERELDDRRFALDHFACKLLTLRDQMHTEAGRALAAQRHDFMVEFVAQMRRELG